MLSRFDKWTGRLFADIGTPARECVQRLTPAQYSQLDAVVGAAKPASLRTFFLANSLHFAQMRIAPQFRNPSSTLQTLQGSHVHENAALLRNPNKAVNYVA